MRGRILLPQLPSASIVASRRSHRRSLKPSGMSVWSVRYPFTRNCRIASSSRSGSRLSISILSFPCSICVELRIGGTLSSAGFGPPPPPPPPPPPGGRGEREAPHFSLSPLFP